MQLNELTAISPLDGRYRSKTQSLATYFSEFGLIKYRVRVEIEYLIKLNQLGLKAFNHQSGDTEGIVNYALGIKGIRMAVFFCERDHLIKISFRSKDNFSVKELAAAHFSGGGHRNAAGGRSTESLEATVTRFLALLPDLKQELNPGTTNHN